MIKKNYGRIFQPCQIGVDFAKSPQAICFDNYVRVYFSYCVRDKRKLVSKVAYVDFNNDFSQVVSHSTSVINEGILGAYDEHGIFPFSPFKDGNDIKALISGWSRRVSVSVETSIGLAVSHDNGNTFERVGNGPILTSNVQEPFLVVDGFIVKVESIYHMFYIFGTEWNYFEKSKGEPERTYKIGHAQSDNLLDWKRDGVTLLPDRFLLESQALPSVVRFNNMWHMFFCYRQSSDFRKNPERSYRIGYASSQDLSHWMRQDEKIQIPMEEWNGDMQCYPNAFVMDDELYLLYNGNNFGKNGFGLLKIDM